MKLAQEEIHTALRDVERGWYSSAELRPWFVAWAKREGREKPSVQDIGRSIGRELTLETRTGHNHVRKWFVSEEGLTCRNWFKAT